MKIITRTTPYFYLRYDYPFCNILKLDIDNGKNNYYANLINSCNGQ